MNSMISEMEQWRILHNASRVLVDTDSFAFKRRIVELLIFPFTCSVYVVAPVFFIVSHNRSYEIKFSSPHIIDRYAHYCL